MEVRIEPTCCFLRIRGLIVCSTCQLDDLFQDDHLQSTVTFPRRRPRQRQPETLDAFIGRRTSRSRSGSPGGYSTAGTTASRLQHFGGNMDGDKRGCRCPRCLHTGLIGARDTQHARALRNGALQAGMRHIRRGFRKDRHTHATTSRQIYPGSALEESDVDHSQPHAKQHKLTDTDSAAADLEASPRCLDRFCTIAADTFCATR